MTQSSAVIDQTQRGIAHLMHPQVLGTTIGSTGATVFVLANKDALPAPWSALALAIWAAAILACGWATLVRPRAMPEMRPPHPRAGLVYVASVVGMLVFFALGRPVLVALGHPELQPAVIVIGVGLHFIPFATAFNAPVFLTLGWSLAALGAAGLVLGFAVGSVYAAACAVAAGIVMLALMTWDAAR